jgi:hypothetical protein
MSRLTDWLRGGSHELGWDDLIRQIVDAVAALARYAERGQIAFPPEVVVSIVVGEGSVEVIREFVGKPELDREVTKALANRCDCEPHDLPVREYAVSLGDETSISATEGAAKAWQLVVEGGDRSGEILVLPAGRTELRFGRGEWHGSGRHIRNDLVICETTSFVSRRAGTLIRAGHQFEVAALDQGDALLVKQSGGDVLRPARTARGRVAVRPGDVIELTDGRGDAIRLRLRRTGIEG